MIEIRHFVNIYLSLYNYKNFLIEQKLNTDAQEIQKTIEFILNKEVADVTKLEFVKNN